MRLHFKSVFLMPRFLEQPDSLFHPTHSLSLAQWLRIVASLLHSETWNIIITSLCYKPQVQKYLLITHVLRFKCKYYLNRTYLIMVISIPTFYTCLWELWQNHKLSLTKSKGTFTHYITWMTWVDHFFHISKTTSGKDEIILKVTLNFIGNQFRW